MNPDNTYRITALSDRRILKVFEAFSSLEDGATFTAEVSGAHVANLSTADEFTAKQAGKWDRSRILTRVSMRLGNPSLSIIFRRGTTTWQAGGHTQFSPSAWENEISLQWSTHGGEPSSELRFQVAAKIAELQTADLKPVAATDAFTEAMASQVARLAELQASILEDVDQRRRKQESTFLERKEQLESDQASLVAQIRASEVETRERLAEEISRLELQKKALDDRGHMHARRQLRGDITKDLKDRLGNPGVSKQAIILRLGVIFGGTLGIVGSSFIATFSLTDLHTAYSNSSPDPIILAFASARFFVPTAAAAALLFYILGWLRKLHAEDVQAERDLERYRYDLDRASWAIETILEAQGKEGGTVPPEWIAGVTHGLFARSATNPEDRDAADALGSLLNFAAKAEFGPSGPRFEFNKRDLRRLSREAASDS